MSEKTLTARPASKVIKEELLPAINAVIRAISEVRVEVREVQARLRDVVARLNSAEIQLAELQGEADGD